MEDFRQIRYDLNTFIIKILGLSIHNIICMTFSRRHVLMNTSFVLLSGLGDYLGLIDVVEEFSSWTYILTFVLGGGGACWTMTVV